MNRMCGNNTVTEALGRRPGALGIVRECGNKNNERTEALRRTSPTLGMEVVERGAIVGLGVLTHWSEATCQRIVSANGWEKTFVFVLLGSLRFDAGEERSFKELAEATRALGEQGMNPPLNAH
jgi:hypothetical protein